MDKLKKIVKHRYFKFSLLMIIVISVTMIIGLASPFEHGIPAERISGSWQALEASRGLNK